MARGVRKSLSFAFSELRLRPFTMKWTEQDDLAGSAKVLTQLIHTWVMSAGSSQQGTF